MSEQDKPSLRHYDDRAGGRRGVKFIPALAAFTIVGLSLYASQTIRPGAKEHNVSGATAGAAQKDDDKALALATKAAAAGKAFLDTLDAKQRAVALLDFDSKKKSGWSNLPITAVPRNGVRLGDMTKAQRDHPPWTC